MTALCQLPLDISTDVGGLAAACVIAFLAFMLLLSTAVDLFRERSALAAPGPATLLIMHDACEDDSGAKVPLVVNEIHSGSSRQRQALPATEVGVGGAGESFVLQLLGCFSLYRNVPKLTSMKIGHGAISSLNGIRVFSMAWVVLGHVYFWQEKYVHVGWHSSPCEQQ